MIINPLAGIRPSSNMESPKSNIKAGGAAPTADYNMFLKLLIAQLKNQDPTAPSDPTKYVSQLASFSAVEEATKTNKKLDDLYFSNMSSLASSLVGKHLVTHDGKYEGDIKSAQAFIDGVVVELTDGTKVILNAGDTISNPKGKDPKKLHKFVADANNSKLKNSAQDILDMLSKSA